jgi:hypothetical protein
MLILMLLQVTIDTKSNIIINLLITTIFVRRKNNAHHDAAHPYFYIILSTIFCKCVLLKPKKFHSCDADD